MESGLIRWPIVLWPDTDGILNWFDESKHQRIKAIDIEKPHCDPPSNALCDQI